MSASSPRSAAVTRASAATASGSGCARLSSPRSRASSAARRAPSSSRLAWSRAVAGTPSRRPTRAGSCTTSHRRSAGVSPAHQRPTSAGPASAGGRRPGGTLTQPAPAAAVSSARRALASRSAAMVVAER
ncbi:hypothetical protein DKT69_01980 [Micromonospora sicca]|uniref:Uncharacterized protein n=1 Tax=Micromonospora sicca TaxID=2202420 RepID=A0A317DR51_9ACTN|nr:hypothetical protein DKT69_01980 [Micromonospora sp. 4G51]